MNEQIIYCQHCGNKTGHIVLYTTNSTAELYNVNNHLDKTII